MKARVKVWLEDDGQIMGEGLYKILQAVDRYGSLNRAAAQLKMSYRHAWGRIKKVEKRLGIPILDTRVGGETGGGAVLTAEGKELVDKFGAIKQEVEQAVEQAFAKHFQD